MDRLQHGQRRLGAVRDTESQACRPSMLVARPGADRQPFLPADGVHLLPQGCDRLPIRGPIDAQVHGENTLGVVIVHLDLGDIGPGRRNVVDNRIGEAAVVGTDGCEDNLHSGILLAEGGAPTRASAACYRVGSSPRLRCRQTHRRLRTPRSRHSTPDSLAPQCSRCYREAPL